MFQMCVYETSMSYILDLRIYYEVRIGVNTAVRKWRISCVRVRTQRPPVRGVGSRRSVRQ